MGSKKYKRVVVNFTMEEYRRMYAAAGLKGLNLSNFVRLCVLPHAYSIKPVERFIRDVLRPEDKNKGSFSGYEADRRPLNIEDLKKEEVANE